MPRFEKGCKGFTLLELLVVIIIIGVLASVALPQFGKAVDRAREAEAANILGAILNAEFVYFQEHSAFQTDLTKLIVGIPVMKDWAVPTTATLNAGPPKSASITINSIANATHTHTAAEHNVVGKVDENSVKTITWTRL